MWLVRSSRLVSLAAVSMACCLGIISCWLPFQVRAQQLSIRHFDVSDGLAHSHVTALHQDTKGYLWLATWEGLSRYDGYQFTNFGMRDGLGDPIVNAIAEDSQGHLWVATNGGGVSRLIDDRELSTAESGSEPQEQPRFERFNVGDSGPS